MRSPARFAASRRLQLGLRFAARPAGIVELGLRLAQRPRLPAALRAGIDAVALLEAVDAPCQRLVFLQLAAIFLQLAERFGDVAEQSARSGGSASVSAFDSAVSSGFFESCGWRSWISVSISAS